MSLVDTKETASCRETLASDRRYEFVGSLSCCGGVRALTGQTAVIHARPPVVLAGLYTHAIFKKR